MRKILKEHKVSCPAFQIFNNINDIKANSKTLTYPLVIKPSDMAASIEVTLINNFDE